MRSHLFMSHRSPLQRRWLLLATAATLPLLILLGMLVALPGRAQAGEVDAPPVFVPWVQLAPQTPTTPTLRGRLQLADAPLSNAAVTISDCSDDATAPTPLVTVTTTPDGAFEASIPTILSERAGKVISLTVDFAATAPITIATSPTESVAALNAFASRCAPAGAHPLLELQPIDVQAPVFVSPTAGALRDMPISFIWMPRAHPEAGESIRWRGMVQFDCGACPPVEILTSPMVSDTTSIEWCAIAPHSGATDVLWVDYTLLISNTVGAGETFPQRVHVGETLQACPPLP